MHAKMAPTPPPHTQHQLLSALVPFVWGGGCRRPTRAPPPCPYHTPILLLLLLLPLPKSHDDATGSHRSASPPPPTPFTCDVCFGGSWWWCYCCCSPLSPPPHAACPPPPYIYFNAFITFLALCGVYVTRGVWWRRGVSQSIDALYEREREKPNRGRTAPRGHEVG